MPSRTLSEEANVIDLYDEVLGSPALRQHRFDWLRGDARPGKQSARLPVDSYYPEHQLVRFSRGPDRPPRSPRHPGSPDPRRPRPRGRPPA